MFFRLAYDENVGSCGYDLIGLLQESYRKIYDNVDLWRFLMRNQIENVSLVLVCHAS